MLLDSQRCYFESKKKDFPFSSILHCWFKHVLFNTVVLKSWTALQHIDNLDFYCKLNFGKKILPLSESGKHNSESSLCKPRYMQTHCQLAVRLHTETLLKAGFCFHFSEDKTGFDYRPPFDQRDARASQLSHFNFYFNPFFQTLTSLLFQLTTALSASFMRNAVLCVTQACAGKANSHLFSACNDFLLNILSPNMSI